MMSRVLLFLCVCLTAGLLVNCSKPSINNPGSMSSKTGRKYTKEENGFSPIRWNDPGPAPGLVFVEGGTFHMGGSEKDIAYDMDNRERQVTVQSFYMDETEVANVDWKEFLHHQENVAAVPEDSIKKIIAGYNGLVPGISL